MFRSLRNDAIYRESRASTDAKGRPQRRERGQRSSNSHNERGRMLQVSSWIQTEFQVQRELHAAGADVPVALSQIGNAILMGWVGDDANPAPRLSDVVLEPDEAPALFEQLLHNIALFLANHRIHGDLSAYNILYWQGAITVIDFAQMVDPRYNPDVYPLLERDIERVCSYFARYGIVTDPAAHAADLWARYLMGDLEVAS
jgi:RIO kinase 1